MSVVGRLVTPHRQQLAPGALLAVVVGILGMHALLQHCPTPAHGAVGGGVATTVAVHVHEHAEAVVRHPVAAAAAWPTDGSLDDVVMLCSAMLLGAGALLTSLLKRRARRRTPPAGAVGNARRPLVLFPAGTGPPPTLAYTVVRC